MSIHPFGNNDVVCAICMYTLDIKSIGRLGLTCKTFSDIFKMQLIWAACANRLLSKPISPPTNWYQYVKDKSTIHVNIEPSNDHPGCYIEINIEKFIITIRKPNKEVIYPTDIIMNEVLKRLKAPYTISRNGKTFVAYYYNNIKDSGMKVVPDISLHCSGRSTETKEWMRKYEYCKNTPENTHFIVKTQLASLYHA